MREHAIAIKRVILVIRNGNMDLHPAVNNLHEISRVLQQLLLVQDTLNKSLMASVTACFEATKYASKPKCMLV